MNNILMTTDANEKNSSAQKHVIEAYTQNFVFKTIS